MSAKSRILFCILNWNHTYYCPDMRHFTNRHVPIPRCCIILPKEMYFNENTNMTYTVMTFCNTTSVCHILRLDGGCHHNTYTNPYHNQDKAYLIIFNIYCLHLGCEGWFWWQKMYGCQHTFKAVSVRHAINFTRKFLLWGFKIVTET